MLALSGMINSLSDAGSNRVHRPAHDKFWNINLQIGRVRGQESGHEKDQLQTNAMEFQGRDIFYFDLKYFIWEVMSKELKYVLL